MRDILQVLPLQFASHMGSNQVMSPIVSPHDKNTGSSCSKLTSSLRGQLVECFTTLLPITRIFFVEKMREASQLFSTKNIGIFEILKFKILTKC